MHRSTLYLTFLAGVCAIAGRGVASEAQRVGTPAPAAAPDRLVPIAPCRLLDTRTTPPLHGEEAVRTIVVAETFCGRTVPSFATAYSLRITTYDRQQIEHAEVGMAAPPNTLSRTDPDVGGKLRFPVPPRSEIGVDVEGYYVAPGTPIDPFGTNGSTAAAATPGPGSVSGSAQRALKPAPAVEDPPAASGTKGVLYLSAQSPFTATGARLAATDPYASSTIVQTGGTDGNACFWFFNSAMQNGQPTGQLMKFRSDGPMQLSDQVYVDGHIEYHGSNVIRTNVLNNFTVDYPRDSAGGATNRVVYFRAKSNTESGSPSVTRFEASTEGYTQGNVNFDSQYSYAVGSNYHFRALAGDAKETFWIKPIPALDGNTAVNTRAKLYVSGPAGFGTDTPLDAIHAKGSPAAVRVEENTPGSVALLANDSTNGPYLVSHTGTDGNATIAVTAHRIRFGAGFLLIEDAPQVGVGTHRDFTPRLQIDGGGRVLVGSPTVDPNSVLNVGGNTMVAGNVNVSGTLTANAVVNAVYGQDVAEWVRADRELPAGTVVIVNPDKTNEVMPSTTAYDTTVAGVVSGQPGVILGRPGELKATVATSGRVRVRVDARKGAVRVGDLLVTSDEPGTAMKSQPLDVGGRKFHQPGTILGKALEPLPEGVGEILVLLCLG